MVLAGEGDGNNHGASSSPSLARTLDERVAESITEEREMDECEMCENEGGMGKSLGFSRLS